MVTLETRVSAVETRVDEHSEVIGGVHDAVVALDQKVDRRFEAVDQRFEAVDRRFEAVDRRFEAVDRRFDAVEGRSYLDTRNILQGRLLALNSKPKVTQWLREKKRRLLEADLSPYDKGLIRKLL